MVLSNHKVGIISRKAVKLIQKLSPKEQQRTPVQRLTLSPEKQAAGKIHEQS